MVLSTVSWSRLARLMSSSCPATLILKLLGKKRSMCVSARRGAAQPRPPVLPPRSHFYDSYVIPKGRDEMSQSELVQQLDGSTIDAEQLDILLPALGSAGDVHPIIELG